MDWKEYDRSTLLEGQTCSDVFFWDRWTSEPVTMDVSWWDGRWNWYLFVGDLLVNEGQLPFKRKITDAKWAVMRAYERFTVKQETLYWVEKEWLAAEFDTHWHLPWAYVADTYV